ncbi:MAG: GntR family transcriptional regulator [Lentisphaeria bacterium]|nr:MAG: GntR family transcriptional regulator [Lentisphaeria bacterium]
MRQPELLKTLRSRITGGEFPPGAALPLRHVLLAEYGLSVATFQKSINRLIEEGFLETRGIKGTVVSEYPPHLCHYALVFPENPKQIGTVDTFFTALRSVGRELETRTPGMRLLHYFVDNTNSGLHQELARLIEDAENRLLAGIIFVNFAPSPEIQTALAPLPVRGDFAPEQRLLPSVSLAGVRFGIAARPVPGVFSTAGTAPGGGADSPEHLFGADHPDAETA